MKNYLCSFQPLWHPNSRTFRRFFLSGVFGLLLVLGHPAQAGKPETAPATETSIYRESLARCPTMNQTQLRAELVQLSQEIFTKQIINFSWIVERRWIVEQMDDLLDKVVDRTSEAVMQEYGAWQRIKSSFSKKIAQEMAEKIAKRAFLTGLFKERLEDLAKKVAEDLNKEIQERVKASVVHTLECIQTFLQNRYHASLREVFQSHVYDSLKSKDFDPRGTAKMPSVAKQRLKGIAGVGLVVTGTIVRALVTRVSQQVVTRVAHGVGMRIMARIGTKFIPWIGWGLLLWDAWDIVRGRGAIPEIRKALKTPQVRQQMRKEITLSIQEIFEGNYRTIAREIADSLFQKWEEFRKPFETLLALAEKNPDFRALFTGITAKDQLYLLVRLYSMWGEEKLLAFAKQGHLDNFLKNPYVPEMITLLQYNPKIEYAFAWLSLAGPKIKDVISKEIYKHKTPQMNPTSLSILVDLKEARQVSKLALLEDKQILAFHDIHKENRRRLIENLEIVDLKVIADYLPYLKGEARNILVTQALAPLSPLLQIFRNKDALSLIKNSRDPGFLVNFFLLRDPYSELQFFLEVPWQAYLIKYGAPLYWIIGGLLLILFPFAFLSVWFASRPIIFLYRFSFGLMRKKKV